MAINPQINDMAWFGKPADPIGSFQKGMNLAEQSQRMKQSADMHPLKMADLQSQTAYRSQQTSLAKQRERHSEDMHPLDMAAKRADTAYRTAVTAGVEQETGFNEKANPKRLAAMDLENAATSVLNKGRELTNRYNEATLGSRIAGATLSLQQQQQQITQAEQMNPLLINEAKLRAAGLSLQNGLRGLQQNLTALNLSRQAKVQTDANLQMPMAIEEMRRLDKMSNEDLANHVIPSWATSPEVRSLISAHVSQLKGRRTHTDYVAEIDNAANEAKQRNSKAIKQVTSLPAGVAKVLEATDSVGRPRFRDANGNLNSEGQDLADRLSRWNDMKKGAGLTATEANDLEDEVYGAKVRSDKYNSSLGLGNQKGNYSRKGEYVGDVFVPSQEALEDLQDKINDRSRAPAGMQLTKMVVNGKTYERPLPVDIKPKYREAIAEHFKTLMSKGTMEEDEAWSKAKQFANEQFEELNLPVIDNKPKFDLSSENNQAANVIKAKLAAIQDFKDKNPDWDKNWRQDIDVEQDKDGRWYVEKSFVISPDDYDSLKEAVTELKKELGDILGDRDLVEEFLKPPATRLDKVSEGVYRYNPNQKKQ